jgi:hypothetical protein
MTARRLQSFISASSEFRCDKSKSVFHCKVVAANIYSQIKIKHEQLMARTSAR